MGKRNKQKRIGLIEGFDNVYQDSDLLLLKDFFSPQKPLVLELGCGKGTYTTSLAEMFPEKNFVGVDVKGERIFIGAKYARLHNLSNVRFVRGAVNNLTQYIDPQSVAEIWITFPDPFPRKKQAKHRLTSPEFLQMYKKVLVPGGKMHLKTDDLDLFEYSLEVLQDNGGKILQAIANIYQEENLDPVLQIQTDFEKKHLAKGRKIYYLQAMI